MPREEPALFDSLPEQERPEGRGETAPPRLRRAERRQVELRAVSLEDLLPAEHRARFVWAFAEGLDLSALYARIKAVEGAPGHPPADPRILVALWLYATIEGVGQRAVRAPIARARWGPGSRAAAGAASFRRRPTLERPPPRRRTARPAARPAPPRRRGSPPPTPRRG